MGNTRLSPRLLFDEIGSDEAMSDDQDRVQDGKIPLIEIVESYAKERSCLTGETANGRVGGVSGYPFHGRSALDQILLELRIELASARGRVGAPFGPWKKKIPCDAWPNLDVLDLKRGLVGESRELPATCLWDVHVQAVPHLEIWEGPCEYLDNAAMLLAMKFGVHVHDAEDAVRSAAFLGKAELAVWREGGFVPYTEKIVRTGDIAIDPSRIIPGFDHIGVTYEGAGLPTIHINTNQLDKWFAKNLETYRPVVTQAGSPPHGSQVTKTKQYDRVLEAFEDLPPDLRDAPRDRGWQQRVADRIREICPDIQDVPRVLREVLGALKMKPEEKPER